AARAGWSQRVRMGPRPWPRRGWRAAQQPLRSSRSRGMSPMSLKTTLTGWARPPLDPGVHIRRYSTTRDILSVKPRGRQYGYFGVRGFSSATNTQRYFGTLVHDVLDRINRDYRAAVPLPSEADVELLVGQAHDRLIRTGVRPFNPGAQQKIAAT